MSEKSVTELLRDIKIHQIANPRLVQAPGDISVQCAVELMQEKRSGYIIIAENNKVVGIFTETDVMMQILNKEIDWNRPVKDFMVTAPKVLSPQDPVGAAIDLMSQYSFYHIPLVGKDGELSGVLSVRSLIRFLSDFYPTEVHNLPPNPDQIVETEEGG